MAWTTAYATATEYRNRIAKSITTDDPAIDAGLTAISRMLEEELGGRGLPRVFNQSVSEARYFDAGTPISDDDPRSKYLVTPRTYGTASGVAIDDLVTLTEVASDVDGNGTWETVAAASDTYLRPYNAAIYGKPYTRLLLAPLSSVTIGGFAKAVRVTGVWGWPSVPTPIKEATIQLAAILRIETPRAQATVSELGQLVGMSPEAAGIVNRLKSRYKRVGMSL